MSEKSQFDQLLEEIGVLAKASDTSGDAAIAAAAGGTDGDGSAGGGAEEVDETEASEAPEGEEAMGKSFTLKLADGTEVDAVDGAVLLKALTGRQEAFEVKAIEGMSAIVALVKSMQGQVAKLGAAPQPRKSVIAVTEKPAATMAKSEPGGIEPQEFLVKALRAQAEGKITGREVAIAEMHINSGKQPPAEIVRAVLA